MQHSVLRASCCLMLLIVATLSVTLFATPKAQAQPPTPVVPLAQLDVSENDVLNATDITRVVSAWASLQYDGACQADIFAKYDVNNDGCVDVVDAQIIASNVGQYTGNNAPLLGAAADAAASSTTFVVDSSANDPDEDRGDGACATSKGECTLLAAIQEANKRSGRETINFNIRNADGSCPALVKIEPPSYPSSNPYNESWYTIEDPNNYGVTIDGYSQCGASENTKSVGGNAVIKIEVKGKFQKDVHGLHISSANNIIRGIAFYNWDRQLFMDGKAAQFNHFEGNIIGTNAQMNVTSRGMGTHHTEGIRIQYGPTYNVVGCGSFDGSNTFVPCTDQSRVNAMRNMVAGNGNDGVHLQGGVTYNHIVGNYIGLKQDGETGLRNQSDGVDFEQGPQYNWLGGTTPAERNVISGNYSEGIEISHGTDTQFNHVAGNYFGTNAAGTKSVQNGGNGVSFEDTVDSNYAHGNVVSGNFGNGFRFYILASRNEVRNNIVGLAADNEMPLPNGQGTRYGQSGVLVMGGSHNNIIAGNHIAYNPANAINLSISSDDDHDGYGATWFNTISQNSMHDNVKYGIDGIGTTIRDANQGIKPPVITAASTSMVRGTACANCTIEVFIADKSDVGGADGSGEGKTFIGMGVADGSGSFTVQTASTVLGQIVTATTTDPQGNTSQFARNVAVTTVQLPVATPTTPADATPTTPADATPTTPADATPTTPADATPTTPADATPTTPADATPTKPADATPITPVAATPPSTPVLVDGTFKVMLPLITR